MRSRATRAICLAVSIVGAGTLLGRLLGYNFGGRTFVRCRQGHLFTTIWIPGVKLKAVDLGIARLQRCPVGRHWSLVCPVRRSALTPEEQRLAREHHDAWIP